jgi:hypothetical protein
VVQVLNVSTRGIRLLPAVLVAAFVAGCSGGGSVAPRSAAQSQTSPSGAKSSASFERFRASVEASTRKSLPAGYAIQVGSTYVTNSGKMVYGEANVGLKTASKIGFVLGSKSVVYDRSQITEVPNTFIKTGPSTRQSSTIHHICDPNAEDCSTDPPPDPQPTDAPDQTTYVSGTTPSADRIALARGGPCTQQFHTNGYPGAYETWSNANINTWSLHFTPGYPNYGGTDWDYAADAIWLVDGTEMQYISGGQYLYAGIGYQHSLVYGDDIHKVSEAATIVYDETPYGTNTIYGNSIITCPSDSSAGVLIAPQSQPTDQGPGNGWGNHVIVPQGPA